jgi:uncharacterized protein YkwD
MLRAWFLAPWLLCSCMAQEEASPAAANERQVVLEMSQARSRPREWARWLRTQAGYFEGPVWKLPGQVPLQTEEGLAALAELIAFLEQAPLDLGPLRWSEGLSRAARHLVLEQGPTGQTGHTGPGGSTLQSRALGHGLFQSLLGEVISYGPETPRWTVVQLLIDDGVPGRGHRNAIFNPAFHTAGAAIGPHAVHGEMTVVDLADAFVANP